MPAAGFADWLAAAEPPVRDWLAGTGFKAEAGCRLPAARCRRRCSSQPTPPSPGTRPHSPAALPAGDWRLDDPAGLLPPAYAALGWALAAYRFTRYRRDDAERPRLVLPEAPGVARSLHIAEATWQARDLVNTPANDLGPAELAEAVVEVAARFGAECQRHRRRRPARGQLSRPSTPSAAPATARRA